MLGGRSTKPAEQCFWRRHLDDQRLAGKQIADDAASARGPATVERPAGNFLLMRKDARNEYREAFEVRMNAGVEVAVEDGRDRCVSRSVFAVVERNRGARIVRL